MRAPESIARGGRSSPRAAHVRSSGERPASFASARAEVAGGEAGVQPRLGVEQKGTGERDALARLEAPHDRVEVAAARAQDDLDAVEHPGHASRRRRLSARPASTTADCGTASTWPGGRYEITRGFRTMPPQRVADRPGLLGRDVRMHRAPPAHPLKIGERPGLPRLAVDRAAARVDGESSGWSGQT